MNRTYSVTYCPVVQYTNGLGNYGNKDVFKCRAVDALQAEHECLIAHPDCKIISIDERPSLQGFDVVITLDPLGAAALYKIIADFQKANADGGLIDAFCQELRDAIAAEIKARATQ